MKKTAPGPAPAEVLHELITGYQVTQAVHVAAALSIADLLAGGPQPSDALAEATGTHPGALYRLLRALASVGVLEEEEDRRFRLTPVGDCLRSDAAEPLGDWAVYLGRASHWRAWTGLLDSVRTGRNAFLSVHGVHVNDYRIAHQEEGVIFDRAMTDQSRNAIRGILAGYDFGTFGTVVDIGGGEGALLAALIAGYPKMHGILFDQPHVAAGARRFLADAGISDRCQVVAGSYFDAEAIPRGGDAYLLKNILESWEDEVAVEVLRNCHQAMPAGAVLLVIEREIGRPNENRAGKFSDLNMLVSPGGQNRTTEEFQAVFAAAGFTWREQISTAAGLDICQASRD